MFRLITLARLCLALAGATGVVAASPLFDIIPIAAPAGSGAYAVAGLDINNRGDVVGFYSAYLDDGISRRSGGIIYTDAGGTTEFLVAGKRGTEITGINDAGQLAIRTYDLDARSRMMYRYTPGVGLQELGTLGGDHSETRRINALGQITGYSETPDGVNRVFRYSDKSGLQNISGTAGGTGYAINDRGWVAGNQSGQATLFRDEGNINLGPGTAYGVNDAGDVVGETFIVPGHPTAFVYRGGQMTILGDDVFGNPVLTDINENGEAVGTGFVDGSQHAVYWSEATGLVDLNTFLQGGTGWELWSANGINENGQIIGFGSGGVFRLDPIPEPSTWALMFLGGVVAVLWHRRRGN